MAVLAKFSFGVARLGFALKLRGLRPYATMTRIRHCKRTYLNLSEAHATSQPLFWWSQPNGRVKDFNARDPRQPHLSSSVFGADYRAGRHRHVDRGAWSAGVPARRKSGWNRPRDGACHQDD